MDINSLVQEISKIREYVQSKQNNAEIFEWLADCQVYLERYHQDMEYTKQFIVEMKAFKSDIIGIDEMKNYSLDHFDSLAATIKSVQKIKNLENESQKKEMDAFMDLNL